MGVRSGVPGETGVDLLRHILRSLDGRPKAKRRFNLLREETPTPPAMQRGLSVLASFVLFTSIPLAGIWQMQSGQDPSLANPQLLSRFVEINEARASLPDPFSEICLTRDGARLDPGSPAPEKQVPVKKADSRGADERQASLSGLSTASQGGKAIRDRWNTKGRERPQAVRRSRPVQTKERIFYRKAQAYHRHKNFEMATEMYRRVLQEDPGHCDALFHLSSIYMEQSTYAEAYPLVTELVRRKPDDPQGLANLAIAEIALGRPEQAISHLDKALTLEDPPRFKIYFHQGVARSKLHRLEEAIAWYRKAENLDPGRAHLLFNMAVTFDRLERYNEALDCYARFLMARESSSPRERRDVEARIGVLMAYLVEVPKTSSAEGTHRPME